MVIPLLHLSILVRSLSFIRSQRKQHSNNYYWHPNSNLQRPQKHQKSRTDYQPSFSKLSCLCPHPIS
ncbi:hypothetical protein V6Z11_D02G044700 [Gossypium hirsutum]